MASIFRKKTEVRLELLTDADMVEKGIRGGAMRGTSKEKLYQELGLESLEKRRWYRKLCYFYKIFNKQSPTYLLNVIPVSSRSYFTRYAKNVPSFKVRHGFFKNSFFPSTAIEWNKIDKNIRKSESLNIF